MKQVEIVDLFCGVGGLTCGLESSGLNVIAGYDLDSSCKFAYEENNNATFFEKDIRQITAKEIADNYSKESIKVLVGCAPCQPFSNHQKNKKERSRHKDWDLLNEFLRLVKGTRPKIVSMENVPQMMKESVFEDFVKELEAMKYTVSYKVINVADYGVAQNRRRLILLAAKGKRAIEIIKPKNEMPQTVRQAIGHLPKIKAGQTSKSDLLHRASRLSDLNIERISQSKPGGTWRDWDPELLPNCYRKESGKTYSSVYGRVRPDGQSGTLTTQFINYGTGRYGHYKQNRALSLREGAILQSFPSNYKFVKSEEYSIREIARQIGNAVPPKLGEIVGKSIIQFLEEK